MVLSGKVIVKVVTESDAEYSVSGPIIVPVLSQGLPEQTAEHHDLVSMSGSDPRLQNIK